MHPFVLRDRRFPVVLTGSQRPLADVHTDGRANLMAAGKLVASGLQSPDGQVDLRRYAAGRLALEMDAVGTGDMTLPAITVKLMYLSGTLDSVEKMRTALRAPIAGEISS